MAWYNSVKDLGRGLQGGVSQITGGSTDAGVLGMGQNRAKASQINEDAFNSTRMTDKRRKEFANALAADNKRTGATMSAARSGNTTIDQSGASGWEARQKGLADNLQAQMEGRGGPSIAEMQMQKGLNQSLANANAQAASMRGMNPAMALRQTQANAANAQQDTLNSSGMLRAQEQQAARQQYGDLSTSARTQSADMATNQARLNQETALSNTAAENTARSNNQQSEMSQRGLNDQQSRFYREGAMTMDERDRQAKMDLGKLRVNENSALNTVNNSAYQSAATNRQGFISGILGSATSMSDENVKKDIKPVAMENGGIKSKDPQAAKRLSTEVKQEKPAETSQVPSYMLGKNMAEAGKQLKQKYSDDSVVSDEAAKTGVSRVNTENSSRESTNVSSGGSGGGGGTSAEKLGAAIGGAFSGGPIKDMLGGIMGGGGGGGAGAAGGIASAAGGAGGLMEMIGPLAAAMSDERQKKDISQGNGDEGVKKFIDALSAYKYKYKDPQANGAGEHLGVMAQDLEKSDIGKTMVHDTPEGKVVDFGKAGGALLATQAMLNDRISQLEQAFKTRSKARSANG